jgi:hypothetical protein
MQAGLNHLQGNTRASHYVDVSERDFRNNLVQSVFEPRGPEDIAILNERIETAHISERCMCASLRWEFANEYWVDIDSGLVWRSRQCVHPNLEAVEIEVFRPPLG